MNKRLLNKILIILMSILIVINIPTCSKAATFDDIINAGDNFINAGDSNSTITPNEDKLKNLSDTVSGVLLTIALGVTLISIVVMGINFAVQSVEDKAKIKESMVPWIIGVFVSFGAFGIWKITMNVFYNLL